MQLLVCLLYGSLFLLLFSVLYCCADRLLTDLAQHEITNPNLRFDYDYKFFFNIVELGCSNVPIPVLYLFISELNVPNSSLSPCFCSLNDRPTVCDCVINYLILIFKVNSMLTQWREKAKVLNSLTGLLALGRHWNEQLGVLYSPTNSNLK